MGHLRRSDRTLLGETRISIPSATKHAPTKKNNTQPKHTKLFFPVAPYNVFISLHLEVRLPRKKTRETKRTLVSSSSFSARRQTHNIADALRFVGEVSKKYPFGRGFLIPSTQNK